VGDGLNKITRWGFLIAYLCCSGIADKAHFLQRIEALLFNLLESPSRVFLELNPAPSFYANR
jgi:hypothetical protein